MNRDENGCTPDCKCSWCRAVREAEACARDLAKQIDDRIVADIIAAAEALDAAPMPAFNRIVYLCK